MGHGGIVLHISEDMYVNSIPIGEGADYLRSQLLAPPDFKTYLQQEITIG